MYKFIFLLLMLCGCHNYNDQPETYKNTPPSREAGKKGTVGEYWGGHPVPPPRPKKFR